jgi:hypothetical protein
MTTQNSKKQLIKEWKKAFKILCKDEVCGDWDFESLCIGWCLAKGLSTKEGSNFYQERVHYGEDF